MIKGSEEKKKVIRIEIETMKTAVSELQRKRAILSNIKERMAKLAYAVSQQSYVEETVCELRKLKKRMGEIEENLRDLQEALEEICILIEKTEEKVVSYYEEEQQKPQFTRFTIRYNQELLLNPHIQELAPIRLKNEGKQMSKVIEIDNKCINLQIRAVCQKNCSRYKMN